MRWAICAVAILAVPSSALAGEFDILRGSQPTYHWGGLYGGVQGGYVSSVINFGTATGSDVGFILRNTAIEQDQQLSQWNVLSSRTPSGTSFGGFVGYNVEWEDVILGAELNYNRVSISGTTSDSISRAFTDSTNLPAGHHYFYDATVGAQSSLSISDVATLRARVGWEAGCFLPYAFFGLAVGRANTSNSATVSYTASDYPDAEIPALAPLPDLSFGPVTQGSAQKGAYAYGFTAGLGTDVALTSHIFVRGELEYIYFAPVNGIQLSMTTARLGAGLKF